jgi:phospholipid/cholesterol/gamma-HCH transport system substrate-binding protein
LHEDTRAQLSLSILGDASIEFTPGRSRAFLKPGSVVQGDSATDPMKMIAKLDARVTRTLDSFAQTSQEWGKVAHRVNGLLETNSGNLETLVENAATSLQDFSNIMKTTNRIMSDPRNQKNIQLTLESLPSLVEETRKTITTVRGAVQRAEESLAHVSEVTEPLARHSASIAAKLDRGLGNLDVLLLELSKFSRNLSSEKGSLQLLVSDPDLYNNLSRSAGMMESLMRNLEPILKDARIASDKIARNPELLGVGGALRGSDGLKDVEPTAAERGSQKEKVQRTGGFFRGE